MGISAGRWAVNEPVAVTVVKAVRAPVVPGWLRAVLGDACLEEPVVARLPPGVPCLLTIKLTGDRELRRLNRRFLGVDQATDVLSFPSGELRQTGYLGDIAVSWPAVRRQSAEFGHPPLSEMGLLSVHGLLHLLGWDHGTSASERAMWLLTLRCLARAGVAVAAGRLAAGAGRGSGLGPRRRSGCRMGSGPGRRAGP